MVIFNFIYQLKHTPSKTLVGQWVHPICRVFFVVCVGVEKPGTCTVMVSGRIPQDWKKLSNTFKYMC